MCHNHYLTYHLVKDLVRNAVFDQHMSQGKLQNVFTPVMDTGICSFCLHFDSTMHVSVSPFRTLP